jgi:hypothetical protein
MVPGDDAPAAARAAASLADRRTVAFWDPERACGTAWSERYQVELADDLRSAFAGDQEMLDRLEHCIEAPGDCPMWDAAYFFDAGAMWTPPLPRPTWWAKQFGFGFDERSGEPAGTFWRSSSPSRIEPSSWNEELARGLAAIGAAR